MNLNVVTPQDARRVKGADGPGDALTPDDAFTKLIKLIPPIAVGAFLGVQNAIADVEDDGTRELVLWVTLGALMVTSYVYRRRRGVKRASQLVATLVALLIYVFALGGPFAEAWSDYDEWMGTVALFLGTALLVAWKLPEMPNED